MRYLGHEFTLQEGDLIFTGTQEWFGFLKNFDALWLVLPGLIDTEFKVG
ncbi:putative isomerase (fragment) [Limnobacter sp. 130]